MAEKDFFSAEAKQSTAQSIRLVEQQTSAELVVAVRRRSGEYRPAAYHFGFFVCSLVVAYLLVVPTVYSVGAIAADALLGFGLGVALALNVSPLLRWLAREKALTRSVADAARVAFFDLGISRTRGRTGVLVFVSTFEQRAVVLCDIGVDEAALGPEWRERCAALTQAVKRGDLAGFERTLESLGPTLASALPRQHDDVNELPDEVH